MPCTSRFRCTAICVAKVRHLFITAKEIAEKDNQNGTSFRPIDTGQRPTSQQPIHSQIPGRCVSRSGTERSSYWNCEFHILKLCVPYTGTVCSKAWNSVGTLRVLRTRSASGAFRCAWCLVCERRLKAERRSYKRVMHVSNPYAEAHGGRGPCTCREPT